MKQMLEKALEIADADEDVVQVGLVSSPGECPLCAYLALSL